MKKITEFFGKVSELIGKFISFLGKWNEALLFIVLFAAWPFVVLILRIIDPTAAVFDAGVLHAVYLTAMFFSGFHLFIWIGLKLNMAGIYNYLEDEFIVEFKNKLTPWQRALFSFLVVALYFFGVILVFLGIAAIAG